MFAKVKEIISKHLESNGVISWITPITLFESDFQTKIEDNMSDEAVASTMEHAAKNVINLKMEENPVYYTSLFEKLMQILEETRNDWTEKKARLKEFIDRELKTGEEEDASDLGLSKEEFAIFETLRKVLEDGNNDKVSEEEEVYISDEGVEFAKEFAKEFDEKMRSEWYMTDWSENPTKISQVQTKIYMFILTKSAKIRELYGNETISKTQILRDQMLNLAKIHYKQVD